MPPTSEPNSSERAREELIQDHKGRGSKVSPGFSCVIGLLSFSGNGHSSIRLRIYDIHFFVTGGPQLQQRFLFEFTYQLIVPTIYGWRVNYDGALAFFRAPRYDVDDPIADFSRVVMKIEIFLIEQFE